MRKQIILIGSGGHSNVVKDIVHLLGKYQIIGVLDDKYPCFSKEKDIFYAPLSFLNDIKAIDEEIKFIISIGDNKIRKKIVEKYHMSPVRFETIIHPSAIIGNNVSLGHGSVLMPGVIINANSTIGDHCIINTSSVIEHDCKVDSFVHLCPKAAIAGSVKVKEGSQIGIGASIIQGVNIGSWSIIGAGATVINDIPNNCTAVGVPARTIK